jgi:RNA polymerase sigma-70 factor (ECF subfamily)
MNPATTVDQALTTRICARDEMALTEAYLTMRAIVFATVHRLIGDPWTAEEVTQDVFCLLWYRADRFDPQRGRLLPWLLRIARNRALDRLRARRGVGVQDELTDSIADRHSNNPEISCSHNARRRTIASLLRKLDANQRQVIDLAFFEGYSQTEIAKKTGLPLGTVKSRVRSALSQLRASSDLHHHYETSL